MYKDNETKEMIIIIYSMSETEVQPKSVVNCELFGSIA